MRFIFPALLLIACSGGEPNDEPNDETADSGSSDTGTATDTGSGDTGAADTGETDDTGLPVATSPCLWYQGIMSTSTAWTFEWYNSNRIGGRTMRVNSLDADTQTAVLQINESWSQQTGQATFSGMYLETWQCNDDGLYLLERDAQTTLNITGTPEVDNAVTTYDPPAFVRPNAITVGDSWTATYTGSTTHTDGTATETVDSSYTVSATDTQLFSSVEIVGVGNGIQGTQLDGGLGGSQWWAQGFGHVKNSQIWTLTRFESGL